MKYPEGMFSFFVLCTVLFRFFQIDPYEVIIPLPLLVLLWIGSNILDVHSTYKFTKRDGNFESEANALFRYIMKKFGLKFAAYIKMILVVILGVIVAQIAPNMLLPMAIMMTATAIYNYSR